MNITNKPELGQYMTFEFSKEKPIHGWFWYKEGFAPEIVEWAIKNENNPKTVLDPFCGVGTTLLSAKNLGLESVGVDASTLAVFVSKTKTDDYDQSDLETVRAFLEKQLPPPPNIRWEFELFDVRAAFPKRNYNEILALRNAIEQEDDRVRNILLVGLLSILPQSSLVLKDGGVLKIIKDKKALPAREIFKRRVKKMLKDLELQKKGHGPRVFLGDARALNMEDESIDLVVTSPPYLNNIDYSKIYGLELSLLSMSKAEASEVRMRAIRSFIGKQMEVQDMPPEVGEIGERIPIIGTYFKDMELAIKEMFRTLREGGAAHVVVSNSVIHETHILVDEVFAQMAERIGFADVEMVVGAERVADVKPQKVKTRESIVIMRK
ncbi:Modification methylase MjaII [Candidatus Bilamarchaeum dharawalense]|uniref:site-specific DNA-methyltransferase (cytosine-N(4)-specific) n=1 Tax=Candidatus Bilamarchaeum dharawalense TaxID=2885759 RepID=A0A5E4LSI9_9ARCH|nr:Modification methylase MjaII [Candidatus Bilamarchaeum dharawalense]